MNFKSLEILVTGLVQGIGFRPFVFRIAARLNLTGWVQNTNENVKIRVTGERQNIDRFLIALRNEAPPAARIDAITAREIEPESFAAFTILRSDNVSEKITDISPDIAVCDDCLHDIEKTRYPDLIILSLTAQTAVRDLLLWRIFPTTGLKPL